MSVQEVALTIARYCVPRRTVAAGLLPATLGFLPNVALADAPSETPPIEFREQLVFGDFLDPAVVTGTGGPPSEEDRHEAGRIIREAPVGPTPISAGEYFLGGNVPQRFATQWAGKEPWNPVVWEFLKPFVGQRNPTDMIAWCAAFVNWCLTRTGRQGSGSAQAISFLVPSRFEQVPVGQRGDIAVMRFYRDDTGAGTDAGHVGFVDDTPRDGKFTLLAGNQRGDQSSSAISRVRWTGPLRMARDLGPDNGGRVPGLLKLAAFVRVA